VILGAVYIALGLATDSCYALVSARVGRWLQERRNARRLAHYSEGAVLIGLGVVALTTPHRRTP
jgi:threonine/homoserine/homoserine lactone efflux protein